MTSAQINAPDGGYRTGAYRELPVPAGLRDVAEAAWVFAPPCHAPADADPLERVIPETGTSLCFECVRGEGGAVHAPVVAVMGPIGKVRVYRPRSGVHLVGVRLRTEWCETVLGVRPADHLDAVDDGVAALATHVPGLRERLVRTASDGEALAVLTAAVHDAWRTAVPSRTARLAHAALEPMRTLPAPSPGELDAAGRLGVSARHLRRVVGETCPGGLKGFHRVRRLHHAVSLTASARPGGWSALALRAGFYDQAHMIREFRALAGVTPVALRAERVRGA